VRIVYFTESLYPHVDGVSRTLGRLFATLGERGVEFRVVSPFVPGEDVAWHGQVRAARFFRFPLYRDYRISVPPPSRAVRDELERFDPHLVHVVSPTPMAIWAQRWARGRGIPVVASFHTHFVSYFRYYGVPWLEGGGWRALRRFYSRCDRVYAPSWSIIRELKERGIGRTELWSRGIDVSGFSPAHRDEQLRQRVGAGPRRPLVLLVSRLVKEKDLADLVSMDRILASRGAAYRLVLVGDGPMRGQLERELPDAVFAGHSTGAELARWYASADIFVFPSTTETLGNVVLEALASGVPSLVSDRGGPQDLIRDGENGYVLPANRPDLLAQRVEALLHDPALRARLSAAARASASSRRWDEINGALIDSYAALIDGPAARRGG
jgi:phosphatidylinositol alpha 1,6-mannosyltransferase